MCEETSRASFLPNDTEDENNTDIPAASFSPADAEEEIPADTFPTPFVPNFEVDKDLTPYTTFGIKAKARLFSEYSSVKELTIISRSPEYLENEVLHIGGGSNLLFLHDFDGLVLHSGIKGIRRYDKNEDTVYAIVGAGEKWTDFVDWCVDEGLAGVENLAGIPGEVGAAPVQNVGAYGVEAKDVIYSVECFDLVSRRLVTFKNDECDFSYRDSRFKHEWKGRYFVIRVSFKLTPSEVAGNLEYGPLATLEERLGQKPSIRQVAEEVKRIRDAKLPDPEIIGSAGSFFKNPVVNKYFFKEQMQALDPNIKHFDILDKDGKPDEHFVKVPAGWLIEHCGLKGKTIGGAYVYPDNCLVIANKGNASADDVRKLADFIIDEVRRRYAVILHPEVNYIDTEIEVTILGSGTSKGVPEVACDCRVCRSHSPFDKRLRASALVKTHGMNLLIDASPDFRYQALRENILDLDAVLLTHSHYDHVGGIDDLRPFCAYHNIPIYLKEDVNRDLHKRLDYCFRPVPYPGVPTFDMHEIGDEPFFINGLKVIPIHVMHGQLPILGYRIGDFAYITDAKTISEDELDKLRGLKVLVINALRYTREHFAHMTVEESVALIERIKPKEAYLTHFNHEIGLHSELEHNFPPHIHPCYDGLRLFIR